MNIFVARLNFGTDSDVLREVFEAFGEVDSAKVITDHFTGKSRGFAFVEMPNDDEAYAAIEQLNESELDGNTIVVKKAEPRNNRSGGGGGGGGKGNFNRGYNRRDDYNKRDNFNRRDDYNRRDDHNKRDDYNRRDDYNKRDDYNRRDDYNKRDRDRSRKSGGYKDNNYNNDRY